MISPVYIVGKTNLPKFIFGSEQGSRLKHGYTRPRDLAQHHFLILYASVFQVTKHHVHRGTVAPTSGSDVHTTQLMRCVHAASEPVHSLVEIQSIGQAIKIRSV